MGKISVTLTETPGPNEYQVRVRYYQVANQSDVPVNLCKA